jgi:hypothetical protein
MLVISFRRLALWLGLGLGLGLASCGATPDVPPTMTDVEVRTEFNAPRASPAGQPLEVEVEIDFGDAVGDAAVNRGRATLRAAAVDPTTRGLEPLKPGQVGYAAITVDDRLRDVAPVDSHAGVVSIEMPPGSDDALARVRVLVWIDMPLNGKPTVVSRNEYSLVADHSTIWFGRGTPDDVARTRATHWCNQGDDAPASGDGESNGAESAVPVTKPCPPPPGD